ncbi:MAG: class I SAM-dependent methyltransferase [Woeseia sp.]
MNELVSRAVVEAAFHDQQELVVDMLLNCRDLSTLNALGKVLQRRPGMAYDQASLRSRVRRRIDQAFAAAGYSEVDRASGPVVLEIGCGRAENALYVQERGAKQYIGIDPDTSLVPNAQKLEPGIEVVRGTAESLPFSSDSIDFAISFNVLEHVLDPQAVLHEIARVLRPGGRFFTVFGPPFNAATGPHLTRFIDLPYIQHLFSESVVGEFTRRANPYYTVNKRPLSYYRDIFMFESGLETTLYREHITGGGFWLLKAKDQLKIDLPWDELGVSAITTLSTKK